MDNKDTLVLLPALNEEEAIGQTIDDVRLHLPGCQLVVVDNYSTNGTRRIVKGKGVRLISTPRGKGLAVRTALLGILPTNFKWLVMIDADFTYPAEHIPVVISELEKGADVVMGYRQELEMGSMTDIHAFGNTGLSLMASLLYLKWVRDVCTGMWGFRRDALKKFKLTSPKFTLEADFFVNAVKTKCNITQIPISYRARVDGSLPKLKVSDGFDIGWFLIKKRFF